MDIFQISLPGTIRVLGIRAASFPEGIPDAHRLLSEIAPAETARIHYGMSRPENGVIIYHAAAAEKYPGEAENFGCPILHIEAGHYNCIRIADYASHPDQIGVAFGILLQQEGIDPQGYCVEKYDGQDVTCMVRSAS